VNNGGKFFNVANLTIGLLGLVGTAIAIKIAVVQAWPDPIIPKNARFSCQLIPDTQRGGDVWTVMYRHDKGQQPWLKIKTTFGGGYTPVKRCEEISQRLEIYRKDGLINLDYRNEPKTPKQYVICAKTKQSNCSLLVTLKPGSQTEAHKAVQDMTENLLNGGSGVYQNSDGKLATSKFSQASPEIDLTPFLAEEDRIAGSNSAK
jgi:Circadian oscillating protein COP23